jgi:hypothetical protein
MVSWPPLALALMLNSPPLGTLTPRTDTKASRVKRLGKKRMIA